MSKSAYSGNYSPTLINLSHDNSLHNYNYFKPLKIEKQGEPNTADNDIDFFLISDKKTKPEQVCFQRHEQLTCVINN